MASRPDKSASLPIGAFALTEPLLVISLTFALINLAVLIAAWRLTGAFAFPAIWRSTLSQVASNMGGGNEREPLLRTSPASDAAERSRAAAIADSVATLQRREGAIGTDLGAPQRNVQPRADRSDAPPSRAQPLGQSGRRTYIITTRRITSGDELK